MAVPSPRYEDEQDFDEVTVQKCICRPFRLIGLICLLVAVAFCITAIATKWWAHSRNDVYSQGLWTSCRKYPEGYYITTEEHSREYRLREKTVCSEINSKPSWLKSVIVLGFISLGVTCLAIVAITISLCWNSQSAANVAACLAFISLIFMAVALVVFVVMFSKVFDHIDVRMDPSEDYYTQERRWYFGYSYGFGWATCIVLLGAFCLFLFCRIEDEIYEAEKTYKVEKHKTTENF